MDMIRAVIILVLFITVFTSSSHATDIRYCDKNVDYDVKVRAVEITPDPIARGQPATFNLSASTENPISGGKVNVDVAYFGWHVYSESHDLCAETSCPVPSGDFIIAHSQVLPGYTPPGSYSLKMRIVDENKKQLSCVRFDIRIGFGSSSVAAS
ncbi:hypothetical protein RND81_06G200100 [Saponaria officinalis]|uniref:MD-2-related lipid-recognition domain-containing protein n=1 Tax=Saponaria officinalis TaxID=3572 RepID=A0AAW1KC43_SAPOF